jgi:hypothetical protein
MKCSKAHTRIVAISLDGILDKKENLLILLLNRPIDHIKT